MFEISSMSNGINLCNPRAAKDLAHAAGPSGLCNCDVSCFSESWVD